LNFIYQKILNYSMNKVNVRRMDLIVREALFLPFPDFPLGLDALEYWEYLCCASPDLNPKPQVVAATILRQISGFSR